MNNIYKLLIMLTISLSACKVDVKTETDSFKWSAKQISTINDSIPGFVVIELFSSESCYDCPKAEEALNKVVNQERENKRNVILVAEHIDYWNDLVWGEGDCEGTWFDKHSSGFYSKRQYDYTKTLGIDRATPEIFINGITGKIDANEEDINKFIDEYINKDALYGISLDLDKDGSNGKENILSINYKLVKSDKVKERLPIQLNLILVERGLTSKPDKGENCGETLHHDNIAKAFTSKTIRYGSSGTMKLQIPDDVNLANSSVVGFMQNLLTLEIIGGTSGFDFVKN